MQACSCRLVVCMETVLHVNQGFISAHYSAFLSRSAMHVDACDTKWKKGLVNLHKKGLHCTGKLNR